MPRRLFSLDDAQQLLPVVKAITEDAVRRAEALATRLEALPESDPAKPGLRDELGEVINGWVARIQELELEAKGLWLVDFDNGEGYYCWRYPEDSIGHFHGYEDGFAGRMKIV